MVHRAIVAALLSAVAFAQTESVGYTDTPVLPGQKWRVHDINRPQPRVITPGSGPGQPPSDAVVLFNGRDLSNWAGEKGGEAAWKVENGYFEIVPKSGSIVSKQKFGTAQYHIEWATPAEVKGASQGRGNSGVILMSRYEFQVLDSYQNRTYADGSASAIYGQWPPLVNASRPPGEWQSYDILFEAPRFEGGKLVTPAYVTVLHNGVLTHHHQQIIGAVVHRDLAKYEPHAPEEPLLLQDHGTKVRYRNIWVRRIGAYDQQ
jgi:hypothetical protein